MKDDTVMAVMGNDIKYIKASIDDIKRCMKDEYVQKSEFDPIKRIVYGMVSLILVVVLGAIIGNVVMQ